jgi:exocyst complex component 4
MTNESDDFEYGKERQKALEVENARQQRIRDKAPGRKMTGKARAGDIDGVCFTCVWNRGCC